MFVQGWLQERAKTQSVDIVSTKYTPQIHSHEHSALAENLARCGENKD